MIRTALILLTVLTSLLVALPAPAAAGPDTTASAGVIAAARDALQAAQRNFAKWMTIVVLAALAAAVLAGWRIWTFSSRLARIDDLRNAWDTRFAQTADEVLRLKKKLADAEADIGRLDRDVAALRPGGLEAATAQVAVVQGELAGVRDRVQQAEEKLEAVGDHTVVTRRDRAAVEELVKSAERALAGAEAAAARALAAAASAQATTEKAERSATARVNAAAEKAEQAARRGERALALAEIAAGLRDGDSQLKAGRYESAAESYSRGLEIIARSAPEDSAGRLHALHNRALARLRLGDFDSVLADALELDGLPAPEAKGAARLLAGAARLGKCEPAAAVEEFEKAIAVDDGTRQVIAADEDIARLVAAGGRKAAPVKRFIKELTARKPAPPVIRARRSR